MKYVANECCGVFCNEVEVFVNKRLKKMPYAQAGWRFNSCANPAFYDFVSYSSDVFRAAAVCDKYGVLTLEIIPAREYSEHWAVCNFSRTTSRQVTAALQELASNFNLSAAQICEIRENLKQFKHTKIETF